MKPVSLTTYPRTLTRRNGVKKLRARGRIPAVIYGENVETQNLEVPEKSVEHLLQHSLSEIILVDLEIKDDARSPRLALLKQIQHHPLSGDVLHVDFHEVAEDKQVIATVPIELTGEAKGVKTAGGTLEHVLFNVKVKALPKELPEVIYLDVAELDLNETYHVSDLPLSETVELVSASEIPVVTVKPSRVTKTAEEEAAEAAAAAAGEAAPEAEQPEPEKTE